MGVNSEGIVAHKHAPELELDSSEVEELVATLGGAPLPDATPPAGETPGETRRRLEHEAELVRDAERPPRAFERFKILMDVLSEGRRLVELADHKARYALVIVGVLNAVAIVLERSSAFDSLPPALHPWMQAAVVLYAVVTLYCALAAIACLRPRRLHYAELLPPHPPGEGPAPNYGPRGVLFWEAIARTDVTAYRRAWSEVHLGEINAEAVLILHRLARVLQAKFAALRHLYAGLTVLVAVGCLLLGVYAAFRAP